VYPGNKCWINITADLNREGLCKEEILKRLAGPYIEAGTTEALRLKGFRDLRDDNEDNVKTIRFRNNPRLKVLN